MFNFNGIHEEKQTYELCVNDLSIPVYSFDISYNRSVVPVQHSDYTRFYPGDLSIEIKMIIDNSYLDILENWIANRYVILAKSNSYSIEIRNLYLISKTFQHYGLSDYMETNAELELVCDFVQPIQVEKIEEIERVFKFKFRKIDI